MKLIIRRNEVAGLSVTFTNLQTVLTRRGNVTNLSHRTRREGNMMFHQCILKYGLQGSKTYIRMHIEVNSMDPQIAEQQNLRQECKIVNFKKEIDIQLLTAYRSPFVIASPTPEITK
jgi:hypothetical protein